MIYAIQDFARRCSLHRKSAQMKAYRLDNCPVCGDRSATRVSDSPMFAGSLVMLFETCTACGSRWHGVYELIDVVITHNGESSHG